MLIRFSLPSPPSSIFRSLYLPFGTAAHHWLYCFMYVFSTVCQLCWLTALIVVCDSSFAVVLALVSLVIWHVQFIAFTIWTCKGALCMARVYIATKKVFALMFSVWCVRVVPSSRAQCTKKRASSRAQCVFFSFFFSSSRMQDHGLSEKQKKRAPLVVNKCSMVSGYRVS